MGYTGAYETCSGSSYSAPTAAGNPNRFNQVSPGSVIPTVATSPLGQNDFLAIRKQASVKANSNVGFFKGVYEGYQNARQAIQTSPGIFLVAVLYGAKVLLGPAFTALALLAGFGHGAYKTIKGAAHRNSEDAGKGFFTLLVMGMFFLVGAKLGTTLPGKTSKILGKTYTLATTEGNAIHFADRIRAAFGLRRYQAENKELINAYQLHQLRLKSWMQKLSQ